MPKDDNNANNAEAWEQYRMQYGIGATLNAYGAQLSQQIEAKLEAKYVQEQGRRDFWQNFYHRNPDLQHDRKFVSETLDKNINDLSDVPVDQAYDKLADLVRNDLAAGDKRRHLQKEYSMYSGGPGLPDGVVATAPSGQGALTLGDMIKGRAEMRRNASYVDRRDPDGPHRFPAD